MIAQRPLLSEGRRAMLKSLGLEAELSGPAIVLIHPDQTVTRLDQDQYDLWIGGYLKGLSQGITESTERIKLMAQNIVPQEMGYGS